MALTNCDAKLASDLKKNCLDPVVAGVEDGFLFDRDDIDIEATKASKIAGTNLYASLVRKTGKKGYYMENIMPPKSTKEDGTYENRMLKVLSGALLDDGDVPATIIDALTSKHGKFIAVVRNTFVDHARATNPGSSAFEIIGLDVPLTCAGQATENDKASEATNGGWTFALGTKEPKARNYWYSTSYDATRALYDALGTAAV